MSTGLTLQAFRNAEGKVVSQAAEIHGLPSSFAPRFVNGTPKPVYQEVQAEFFTKRKSITSAARGQREAPGHTMGRQRYIPREAEQEVRVNIHKKWFYLSCSGAVLAEAVQEQCSSVPLQNIMQVYITDHVNITSPCVSPRTTS